MRTYTNVISSLCCIVIISTTSFCFGTSTIKFEDNGTNNLLYNIVPSVEWFMTIGRNDTNDVTGGIHQTKDGGYVLVGNTYNSEGNETRFWFMKMDAMGNVLWKKSFDESRYAVSFEYAHHNGFIIGGMMLSEENTIWLCHIDEEGNIIWIKTYSQQGFPFDIQRTNDGYFILGEFFSEKGTFGGLLKVDFNGSLLLYNEFNGYYYSIASAHDDGYLLVGEESNNAMIIKIDDQGNQEWKRDYGKINLNTAFYAIEKTIEGNWAITGEIHNPIEGTYQIWLVNIDDEGNLFLDKNLGDPLDGSFDTSRGCDLEQTFDKGFIIVGVSDNIPGSKGKMSLIKTDSQGNICWNTIVDGYYTSQVISDNIVHMTIDGGYILVGMTHYFYPNIFITKFQSEDKHKPTISIVQPDNGFYFLNKRIVDIDKTVVFGPIDIIVNGTDFETGIEHMELYIDNVLKKNLETPPYTWKWDDTGFGHFDLKVVAFDYAGNNELYETEVWKFF